MSGLWDALHTALSFCGCFCLEPEFWEARGRKERGGGGGAARSAMVRPRQQAYQDIEEMLLPGAEASHVGSDDGEEEERPASALSHAVSSSSEEMYRQGSFNTKVQVLRSTSPFYRSQQLGGPFGGGGGGGGAPAAAAGAADIELKPAHANVLLGQQHLEARGKFPAAHPVVMGGGAVVGGAAAHAVGTAVRRGASPQLLPGAG